MAIYPKDLSKESLELNSSLKLFQIYKNLKHVSIKCDTYFQVYEELFNNIDGELRGFSVRNNKDCYE